MTSPTNTNSNVTMNNSLSTLMRLAMRNHSVMSFQHGDATVKTIFALDTIREGNYRGSLRRFAGFGKFQAAHELFEHASAMFVILELVKACAGRGQENNIARSGQ